MAHNMRPSHDRYEDPPRVRPDAVALAEGLGAGYAPLGAFLAPAPLVDELTETTGFVVSHSYDANPIACAAGSAVLDEIVERDLMGNAERMGARLRAGLERIAARSPLAGDVRGMGLLLAMELVADSFTLARFPADVDPGAVVRRHGFDHGLLLYSRRQERRPLRRLAPGCPTARDRRGGLR